MNPEFKLHKDKWVSLFDLYFKYSSPIPARHPIFTDFQLYQREVVQNAGGVRSLPFVGFATINAESIPKIYVKGDDKLVILKKHLHPKLTKEYDFMWNSVYFRKELSKNMDLLFKKKAFNTSKKVIEYHMSSE